VGQIEATREWGPVASVHKKWVYALVGRGERGSGVTVLGGGGGGLLRLLAGGGTRRDSVRHPQLGVDGRHFPQYDLAVDHCTCVSCVA
jgi:hypothetical protein